MLSGREREALELELLEKARRVGILMKMEQFDWGIVPAWDDFAQMPRRELKARVKRLRPIIRQFCRSFFLSPGAKPTGYDKVEQFYNLEADRVSLAVDTCYEIVIEIWKFVKDRKSPPSWLIGRLNDDRFDVSLVSIQSSLDDVVDKIVGNR